MGGYFDIEYVERRPSGRGWESLRHELNQPYAGARAWEMRAPDAAGTLIVWARDEAEAQDHLLNCLWEMIFAKGRVAAWLENPACIYCGGTTESRGRNSSGTQTWRCKAPGCRKSFVLDRRFRGGIGHPTQSKKPAFVKLVFGQGVPVADACRRLGISHGAGDNWFAKAAAVRKTMGIETDLRCPCGKALRHRGNCWYRMGRESGEKAA